MTGELIQFIDSEIERLKTYKPTSYCFECCELDDCYCEEAYNQFREDQITHLESLKQELL